MQIILLTQIMHQETHGNMFNTDFLHLFFSFLRQLAFIPLGKLFNYLPHFQPTDLHSKLF